MKVRTIWNLIKENLSRKLILICVVMKHGDHAWKWFTLYGCWLTELLHSLCCWQHWLPKLFSVVAAYFTTILSKTRLSSSGTIHWILGLSTHPETKLNMKTELGLQFNCFLSLSSGHYILFVMRLICSIRISILWLLSGRIYEMDFLLRHISLWMSSTPASKLVMKCVVYFVFYDTSNFRLIVMFSGFSTGGLLPCLPFILGYSLSLSFDF